VVQAATQSASLEQRLEQELAVFGTWTQELPMQAPWFAGGTLPPWQNPPLQVVPLMHALPEVQAWPSIVEQAPHAVPPALQVCVPAQVPEPQAWVELGMQLVPPEPLLTVNTFETAAG
jgi:hypothetical protein